MDYELNKLSDDELISLQIEIIKEKNRRNPKSLICYENDCIRKSKKHLAKYKHWSKKIDAVDTSKKNGYAFIGNFLPVDRQAGVDDGSIVVERCDTFFKCYKISENNKELLCEGTSKNMFEFINKVNELISNK